MKILYSVKEACSALSMSRTKLYELIQSGSIRAVKNGVRTFVHIDELQRFAASLPETI
jgi:excisionase family DNA binding protein